MHTACAKKKVAGFLVRFFFRHYGLWSDLQKKSIVFVRSKYKTGKLYTIYQ
jgi:hypothetical protein